MKLTNHYQSVSIETSLTKTQINTVKKFAPKMLTLLDEDDEPCFSIEIGKAGCGAISKYGITFDAVTETDHPYVTTLMPNMPENAEARKKFIEDEFGTKLYYLHILEEQIESELADEADMIAAVADSIHIM